MRLCGGTCKAPNVNTSDLSHNWTEKSDEEGIAEAEEVLLERDFDDEDDDLAEAVVAAGASAIAGFDEDVNVFPA